MFSSLNRYVLVAVALTMWLQLAPIVASAASSAQALWLRDVLRSACAADADVMAVLKAMGGGVVLDEHTLSGPPGLIATRYRLMLRNGTRIRVDWHQRSGALVRVVFELYAGAHKRYRPLLWLVSDEQCNVRAARRIRYANDGSASEVVTLDGELNDGDPVLAIDVPVPAGAPRQGVMVAMVDSGVNYTLTHLHERIARNEFGALIGYDFWDNDPRPFDSHPLASPFFPQRHGSATASVVLTDSPVALVAPYRYPRPDMSRMSDLLAHADAAGVRVVNLSLGGQRREQWLAFEREAARRSHMLFVASAGNEGRDIDNKPVYPAALELSNLITVTSARDDGTLAARSNWGSHAVDLMVPAERLITTGFDGYARIVSGSSYAAARVSGLAACLLAAHPTWSTERLKAAIFAYATKPAAAMHVNIGWIEHPTHIARGNCAAEPTVAAIHTRLLLTQEDWPKSRPGTRLAPLDVFVFDDAGWSVETVIAAVREAQQLLAQCAISYSTVQLKLLSAPHRLRHFSYAHALKLKQTLPTAKLSAWFVRDTVARVPFDAQAIGVSNSRRFPDLAGSVWLTAHVPYPGRGLAHELYHVLADNGTHVPEEDNLMSSRLAADATRLNDWQCERMHRTGRALGWFED